LTLARPWKAQIVSNGLEGVSVLIAEVHHITLPDGASAAPSDDTNTLADKAAHAAGSEQLLTLMDASTGEGLVIHLWKDQAAYEAFAAGRKDLTAESKNMGSQIDSGHLYEVTYRS
jgi:hypothetical protein